MNSDDLVERVRLACAMTSATHPDYSSAVIYTELYEQLLRVFGRTVVNARSGYWLAREQWPAPSQFALLRAGIAQISPRAYGTKLVKVEVTATTTPGTFFQELREIDITEVENWQLQQGQVGRAWRYVIENDIVRLVPYPDATLQGALLTFYLRPPRLVAAQDGTRDLAGNTSTSRGLITAITTPTDFQAATTIGITINAFPFDQTLSTPAAPVGTSNVLVDIVRGGGGWHEVIFRGTLSFAGGLSTITLFPQVSNFQGTPETPASDLPKVRTGDWVRIAGQSEWPTLPDDFHGCLADAAALKILTDLGYSDKAMVKAQPLTADLNRFQDLVTPRTQNSARDIVMPDIYGTTGSRSWQVKFP